MKTSEALKVLRGMLKTERQALRSLNYRQANALQLADVYAAKGATTPPEAPRATALRNAHRYHVEDAEKLRREAQIVALRVNALDFAIDVLNSNEQHEKATRAEWRKARADRG